MRSIRRHCDVLVVGAGPAGIAAATTAAEAGEDVLLVDNNPMVGGQIWRRRTASPPHTATNWFKRLDASGVDMLGGLQVYAASSDQNCVYAEATDAHYTLSYRHLILATGAREMFLPFPGWTLPGVMGVGGLQALVKGGLSVRGKRIVFAGSGPLLLAVAAAVRQNGADLTLITEQASWLSLARFGASLITKPSKVWQSLRLGVQLAGVRYRPDTVPVEAHGETYLKSVTMRNGNDTFTVECDFMAVGFHLTPNIEFARLLGCDYRRGGVVVDDFQQTSIPNVYCAGEVTGIGGVDIALVEGQIAGLAASGNRSTARTLFDMRARENEFAALLNDVFSPRDTLKTLPDKETIVCRCEDVTHGQLMAHTSWRAAKLYTRCGMGACQGRICGPALHFLYDWEPASIRPPLYPVRTESLLLE